MMMKYAECADGCTYATSNNVLVYQQSLQCGSVTYVSPAWRLHWRMTGFCPPVDSHGGRRTFSHTYQTHLCFKPQYQMKCYVWQESLIRQCHTCFSSMAITLADVSGTDRFLSTCGLSRREGDIFSHIPDPSLL